jgi:carboxypeptidase Taq
MHHIANTKELYNQYVTNMRRIADIRYAGAVLQWDQETYLPLKGAVIRGQQVATLTELAHYYFTQDSFGDLLNELSQRADLNDSEKKNVDLTLYDYSKQKKYTSEFVRVLTEAVNRSFHSWIHARKTNSFKDFSHDLAAVVELKKQEAAYLGYEKHPYNALLNEYDRGSSVDMLDKLFDGLKQPLLEIINKIQGKPQIDDEILKQHFPKDKQWEFGMQVLKDLGYDFEAGRQDISEHPFTINFNSNDVRITTRIDENDLGNMTWSCIHELGHALYEQGLPDAQYGLPLGEPASLTVHESQSRLWENHIGRSFAFCERYLPVLQQFFPDQLKGVTAEQLYKAVNKVVPSFIRTEADELTYHFHVMIRYELEKKLMDGSLSTNDIPAFWNEHYRKYLGVNVTNDKQGCLQDIHWSHGSFGYFPTYSLGSLYAAQFFSAALKEVPLIKDQVSAESTQALLQWLRGNIHKEGRMYESEALCEKLTGEPLVVQHFLDHLLDKYEKVYNF